MPQFTPDNSISIPVLFKRFALIFLPVAIIFTSALWSNIRTDRQMRIERIEATENSHIELAKVLLTQDFDAVISDLNVLSSLPALRRFLNGKTPAQRDELAEVFLTLARESHRYDQVRYLDAKGREVIRINYQDGNPVIIPQAQLQDKSKRYYFNDTFKLGKGEIFVSPLDLNFEHGRLEVPYKPMIRFGMPVFDSAGRKTGILLFNYLGSKLLQDFHRIMGTGEHSSMLLNRDGYWLSSPRSGDEWGFMLDNNDRTFGHDFPDEWRSVTSGEKGTLLTPQGLFIYATVHLLLPGRHLSTGSAMAQTPGRPGTGGDEYYWKIVSFVPHAMLTGTAFYNLASGRALLGLVYVLLALGTWMIALFTLSRQQSRIALLKSNSRYDELVRRIPVGAYLYRFHADGSTSFDYVSPVFCQILGLHADAVLHHPEIAFAAAHPDDRDDLIRANQDAAASLQPFRWQGRFIVHGNTRWIRIASDAMPQPEGGSLWSGVISDITESKELEFELVRQARTDVLTGLYNRRHFFELAEQELARVRRHGEPFSMLMLDVDNFKLFNDTYGHHVGDLVLQKLSEVLRHTLRVIDTPGRIGGEEFAILLPETGEQRALEVAERLRLNVANAIVPLEQGGTVHFTVSIGVTCFVTTDRGIDDILKRADAGLYMAKNAGRNRVCSEGAG